MPYHTLIPPGQELAAQYRFNERRSGGRGTRRVELALRKKQTGPVTPAAVPVEISARGLYDSLRRYLGTVGVIRDLSQRRELDRTLLQLRQRLQSQEQLLILAHRATSLSRELHEPLTALLADSQQLLATIRDARLDDRITVLTGHAQAATQLGEALAHALEESRGRSPDDTLHDILDEVLAAQPFTAGDESRIIRQFSIPLPPPTGERDLLVTLFRLLLTYALTYVDTVGRSSRLFMATNAVGPRGTSPSMPALFPLAPPTEVEVVILESDRPGTSDAPTTPLQPANLLECYQLTRQVNGTLDLSAPMEGPLRIVVRLPVVALSHPIESTPTLTVEPTITSPVQEEMPPAQGVAIRTPEPPAPQPERRHNPRARTTLPVKITLDSATWDGTLADFSLGGASVILPGELPAISRQAAYIVLKTTVGILELQGTAYERSTSLPAKTPLTQLVLTFDPPQRHEAAVLASLFDAAREESLHFSLEVMLSAQSEIAQTPQDSESSDEPALHEGRESIRVALKLPVRLHVTDPTDRAHRFPALVINLSRDGACVQVKAPAEFLHGFVTLHISTTNNLNQPGAYEPSAPDSVFSAQIVWSAPEPVAPSELRPHGIESIVRAGVRFHGLTPYAEREINRVVRQHLTSSAEIDASARLTTIVSVSRECRNPRGQAIAMTDDHLREPLTPNTLVVIIAPGYAQTAMDYTALAYYLAHHRIRVLRYDHTNHVGLSEGELQQTALRSMQADLLKVVEFVQHTWPTAPLVVLASDIAARAALKMTAHTRPLDLLLLVNPIIDVQLVLKIVHGHDLVADYQYGLRRGITNLLGLNVNVDRFIGDVIAGRFTDLNSTLEDLRLLRSHLTLFTVPSNASKALPPMDLPQPFIATLGSSTRLVSLPAPLTGQDFPVDNQHPPAFRQVLEQITATLAVPVGAVDLNIKGRKALHRQQVIEMEHLRLRHNLSQVTREALWIAYLQQLPQLSNLHEYWKLLDDLYRLLSPLDPGLIMVDVGVGHSDLARATMVNQAYRARHRGWAMEQSPRFLGVARSRDTLTAARYAFTTLSRELDADFAGSLTVHPSLTTDWVHADWTQSLPFKTDALHRIVCNLSLPFVPSPLITLRELLRILHPQGRLVLTAFHPETDLTVLYRRHLQQANQDEFTTQSQTILHYLGRLREAIRHGLLHTFDRTALTALLRQSGIAPVRLITTLDGHALIAVVEKGNSSS